VGAKNWFQTRTTEVHILSLLHTAGFSICDPELLSVVGKASLVLPVLSQKTLTA